MEVPEEIAVLQLYLLGGVHMLQLLFLLTQMPFNDRFENLVQVLQ